MWAVKHVFVGMDGLRLPSVVIWGNVIIGAGSVVTRSIRSNSIAAGVLPNVTRTLNEFYYQAKS